MRDQAKTKDQLVEELLRTRRRLAAAEARNGSLERSDELWFQGAVAASRNGIVITDPAQPDNPIVYANPAFERMTGYSLEEILGRNCRFLQGTDRDQQPLEELRAALEEGRDCKVVLQNYRKDGTPFWNELSVSPVRDEEGRLVNFVGVLDDITGRKRTEEALRQSEERLRVALRTGGLGSWELDLATGALHSSDVCKANFGLPPEAEFSYEDLFKAIHPEDRARVREKVERAIEDRADYEAEYRSTWPDGGVHWIFARGRGIYGADGTPLRMIGMTLDLTRHKQTEDMLRDDARRLSSVIATQHEIATAKLDLNTVMNLVAERLQTIVRSDGAAVELVEGDELVYRAASGTAAPYLGLRLEIDSSLSGRCVRRGELMHSEDTETDERVDREACRRIGARSMIVVPLHHDRKTVGVLKVLSTRAGAFGERDIDTVRLMTGLIAAGMSHTAEFEAQRAMVEQRTEALARIRESEARFRTIFEGAAIGISLADPEGRFLESNPALQNMLGYSEQDLRGALFTEVSHPEDAAADMDLYRELVAGDRDSYETEKRYLRKDGQTLWGRLKVSSVRSSEENGAFAIGMVEDVTERKRVEEALRESEARYRHLFTQSAESLLVHDAQGRIVDCNDRACAAHGYTRREMLSLHIQDLTDTLLSETEKRLREQDGGTMWQRALTGHSMGPEDAHVGEHIRKDGTRFPVEVWVSGITYGERRMILAAVRDITERKRTEEALLEIREAERRRIARDLHDAVLQDISGALQSLQALQVEAGGSEGDGVEQSLDALRKAAGGLRGAIYDLRESREQPFVREVESLVELNRQMTPEREMALVVENGFPEELPEPVSLEMLRIVHEALVNLRRHSAARRADVALGFDGNTAWARVSDNGRGFDPDATPKGVGLAGMRERALAVGGKLDICSESGKGTSVTARVPLG